MWTNFQSKLSPFSDTNQFILSHVTSEEESTSDWNIVHSKENVKTQLWTCVAQDLLMVIVQLVSPRPC